MRDPFARQFYSSGAWADCREAYRKSIGNLCENCLKNGQINPVDEVHHKIRLTPQNINDPNVTLNWKNLEGLCERCHKLAHKRKRRYNVDESGRLSILDTPLGRGDRAGRGYSGVLLEKPLSCVQDPSRRE